MLQQVAREGTKKTVFTNFLELCKAMNRQLEHVQAFLLAELGTSGNLDGQSRLVVKGRFLPKAFEGVLRRYVNECALTLWEISSKALGIFCPLPQLPGFTAAHVLYAAQICLVQQLQEP